MRSSLALVLLTASACARSDAEPMSKPVAAPVAVAMTPVASGAVADELVLTGELAPDQRAELTADTQGRVIAVMASRGERVKRGDPLLRLDVRSAALSTRQARADLEATRADRSLAELECKRSASLFATGAITKSEADREASRCASALQKVNAAEARADLVAKGVSDGIVRAPFDGVVAARSVAVGEWVAPGRSLVTLVDGGPLKVELAVPEAHVAAIQAGAVVTLSTVSRPGTYRATVTRLGAEIGKSRSLTVEALVDPTPELLPGMFVEARVVVGHTTRPIVPATAVVQRGKTWHAFVVAGGVLEERIVKLGPSVDTGRVSITRGLTTTDRVVIAVTDKIVDGLRVE